MAMYYLGGLGLVLLLTLIPLPKKRLRNTINKYISEKDGNSNLLIKFEKSILVKLIIPKENSRQRVRDKEKIKKAGIKISLERIAAIKIGIFIIFFFLTIGAYSNMNSLREKGILEKPSYSNNEQYLTFNDNQTQEDSVNSIESSLLKKVLENVPDYKNYIKNDKINNLAKKIAIERKELGILDENDQIAKNVLTILVDAYTASTITLRDIITILLISIISTGIVDIIIYLKSSVRNSKIEKEFEKIEAVTLLLMNKESVNVISLIQQMKKQSNTLKPYFQQCLNQYPSNPNKALDELIDSVNNNEFTKFITILKQCLHSDKNTNNQILKIQRALRLALNKTSNKRKNRNKRVRLTLMQFPLLIMLILLIMLPFINIMSSKL